MSKGKFVKAKRAMRRHGPLGRSVSRSRFADGLSSFSDIFPVQDLDHAREVAARDGSVIDNANLLRDWRMVGRDISIATKRFSQARDLDDCEA